jgi:hypothetical protein
MSAYSVTGFRLALLLRNKIFICECDRIVAFVIQPGGENSQRDKNKVKNKMVLPRHVFENATTGTGKRWTKQEHVHQI